MDFLRYRVVQFGLRAARRFARRPTRRVLVAHTDTPSSDWRRSAVIYQVYVRSFADGRGDGIGDIAGIRRHLRHIADLGADAVWVNPWYVSPQADAGYDVADYRDID